MRSQNTVSMFLTCGQSTKNGIAFIMRQILEAVSAANGLLHVSFDVDFLDPDLAPGVGTTVPGGATYREAASDHGNALRQWSGLFGSIWWELNPYLDDRGQKRESVGGNDRKSVWPSHPGSPNPPAADWCVDWRETPCGRTIWVGDIVN